MSEESETTRPRRGDMYTDNHGQVRAMAVAENYVMARRKGCLPFVVSVKEWQSRAQNQKIFKLKM